MDITVTLKFRFGGVFREEKSGTMCYVGGKGKIFDVDVDHLCSWDLKELAEECGSYGEIDTIFYLNPSKPKSEGLTKVYDDGEVSTMADLATKHRSIELYVTYKKDKLSPTLEALCKRLKKLTPRNFPESQSKDTSKQLYDSTTLIVVPQPIHTTLFIENQKSDPRLIHRLIPTTTPQTFTCLATPHESQYITTSVLEDYDWEEDRPLSPVPWKDLVPLDEEDEYDADFQPSGESNSEGEDEDGDVDDDQGLNPSDDDQSSNDDDLQTEQGDDGGDTSDEEYHSVKLQVRSFKQKILGIVDRLQKEAQQRKLPHQISSQDPTVGEVVIDKEGGCVSDYCDSDEEADLPLEIDEGETTQQRRLKKEQLVGVTVIGILLFGGWVRGFPQGVISSKL